MKYIIVFLLIFNDCYYFRRYNEFYVLEAKLTEFHGELSIQLPPKRSQQQKGLAYLETKRPEFERYLQVNFDRSETFMIYILNQTFD